MQINEKQSLAVANRLSISDPNTIIDIPFILISIHDTHKDPVITYRDNIIARIDVGFDDVDASTENNTTISSEQAGQIAEFVVKYKDAPLIICQCEAGVSRSSAVAAAILKYLINDDSSIFNGYYYKPNMTVYRRVLEALQKSSK